MRMQRLAAVLALACVLAPAASAQPSQQNQVRQSDVPPTLHGFDSGLQLWESSGVVTAPEAYLNQATLVFEPSYRLGEQHFEGTWAEGIALSARLLWTSEFAGNDPSMRGRGFATPALFADPPTSAVSTPSDAPRATEGLERESQLGDLWIGAFHAALAKVPWIDADVQAGLRLTLPTSNNSWNAGLLVAPSAYVGLSRTFGPVTVGYGSRFFKYLNRWTVAPVVGDDTPVVVNGQPVQPWRPASSGNPNPDWGVMQLLSVDAELVDDVTLSLMYALSDTWSYALESCGVPGVSGADTCRDGAALGDVRRPGRAEDAWFLAEVGWKPREWLVLGLGLSTSQPVRMPDGSLANPFFRATRDNWTTVYLSLGTSAEAIAHALESK